MSLLRGAEWRVCRNSSTNMATLLENLFPNKKRQGINFSLTGINQFIIPHLRKMGKFGPEEGLVLTISDQNPESKFQHWNTTHLGRGFRSVIWHPMVLWLIFVKRFCFWPFPSGVCKGSHARQRKVGTTVAQDWLGLPCPLRASEVVLTGILCDGCGKPIAGGNSEMFSKVLL